MSEFYAKITKSQPAYSVTVQSTPPISGSMTVWNLRDFLRAIDAAEIPDTATLVAEHNYDTKHFTGLRVQYTFKIEAAEEGA